VLKTRSNPLTSIFLAWTWILVFGPLSASTKLNPTTTCGRVWNLVANLTLWTTSLVPLPLTNLELSLSIY
jgi:hypothetical protein